MNKLIKIITISLIICLLGSFAPSWAEDISGGVTKKSEDGWWVRWASEILGGVLGGYIGIEASKILVPPPTGTIADITRGYTFAFISILLGIPIGSALGASSVGALSGKGYNFTGAVLGAYLGELVSLGLISATKTSAVYSGEFLFYSLLLLPTAIGATFGCELIIPEKPLGKAMLNNNHISNFERNYKVSLIKIVF